MAAIAVPLHQAGRVRAPARAIAPGAITAATYRRRQLVAFAIVLLLVVAAVVAAKAAMGGLGADTLTGSEPAGGSTALRPIARSVYVVQPGDTLWEIARALQPTGDVRPLVGKLADQRSGDPLQPGERIALP